MRPLTFLTGAELDEYGNKEIQKLCDFYGVAQTVEWKEDGVKKDFTSQHLIDSGHLLKRVVLDSRDMMWNLWSLITKNHKHRHQVREVAKFTCATKSNNC